MKNFLSCIILTLFGAFISCQESAAKKINGTAPVETSQVSSSKSTTDGPVMTFNKTTHDFGTINEGDKVTTEFSFTNTGSADLIIVDARGSCDSSNKPGMQQKSVTLSANTSSGREMLRIKANVTPDPIKQKQRDAQAKARQQN